MVVEIPWTLLQRLRDQEEEDNQHHEEEMNHLGFGVPPQHHVVDVVAPLAPPLPPAAPAAPPYEPPNQGGQGQAPGGEGLYPGL